MERASSSLLVVFMCLVLGIASVSSAGCVSFSSQLCGDVIQSYSSGQVSDTSLLPIYETFFNSYFKDISIAAPIIAPECYMVAKRFLCGNYFKECSVNQTEVPVCQDLCHEFYTTCGTLLNSSSFQNLTTFIPQCTNLPTTGCSMVLNVPPIDYSAIDCPPPMIRNPDPSVNRSTCPGHSCCLPCPIVENFLEEGLFDRMEIFLNTSMAIFSIFSFLVVVTYIALPSKRGFPMNLVTSLFASIFILYSAFWISIFTTQRELLCVSDVDLASSANSSPVCKAQAFIIFYGFYASVLWFLTMAFNVFMIIYFNADQVPTYRYAYYILNWTLPFIPPSIIIGLNGFGTQVAPFCNLANNALSNPSFFVPIAILIILAFIFILLVFFRVWKISRELKKSFRHVLRLQYRPLIFTTYGVIVFGMYWVYNKISAVHLDWINEWFLCIALGNGQNECAKISQKHFMIPGVMGTYFVLGFTGFVGFLIFCIKDDVINGWSQLIMNKSIVSSFGESTTTNSKKNASVDLSAISSGLDPDFPMNFAGQRQ